MPSEKFLFLDKIGLKSGMAIRKYMSTNLKTKELYYFVAFTNQDLANF